VYCVPTPAAHTVLQHAATFRQECNPRLKTASYQVMPRYIGVRYSKAHTDHCGTLRACCLCHVAACGGRAGRGGGRGGVIHQLSPIVLQYRRTGSERGGVSSFAVGSPAHIDDDTLVCCREVSSWVRWLLTVAEAPHCLMPTRKQSCFAPSVRMTTQRQPCSSLMGPKRLLRCRVRVSARVGSAPDYPLQ